MKTIDRLMLLCLKLLQLKPQLKKLLLSKLQAQPMMPQVLMSLLPGRLAYQYQKLEPYGNYILIALVLIPGLLSFVVTPFFRVVEFVIRGAARIILGIVL